MRGDRHTSMVPHRMSTETGTITQYWITKADRLALLLHFTSDINKYSFESGGSIFAYRVESLQIRENPLKITGTHRTVQSKETITFYCAK